MAHQNVVVLTGDAALITATKSFTSMATGIVGDFGASAVLESMDETSADETYDVKIQHSPDRAAHLQQGVADADAAWYDLVTFTQRVGGVDGADTTEFKAVETAHFSRMRAVATLAGTTPSVKVTVIVEGMPA